MSWIAVAVTAVVGTQVYAADQQRKAIHGQQDALKAAQDEDARKAAEAETGAQVAANAKLADAKRRRRSSALGMGDPNAPGGDSLGGAAGSVLATGGPSPAARAAVGAAGSARYGGTALGAGALGSGAAAGGGYSPTVRGPTTRAQ